MILCDIGNSTFHFLQNNKEFKINIQDSLEFLFFNEIVYFISVNENGTKKLLDKFPKAINLKENYTLKTNYANSLGIDRIAACSYVTDGIVVDCGSAITVDVMENNIHQGGFIMPGFDSLKKCYPLISSKLEFAFETNINFDTLPANTNEAISYALLQMVILPIQSVQMKYHKTIIFTGENSKLILDYFDNYRFEPQLIFNSMKQVIQEKK